MNESSDADGWPALSGWPFAPLLTGLFFAAVLLAYAGALSEIGGMKDKPSTPREPRLLRTSVFLLTIPLLCWAALSAGTVVLRAVSLIPFPSQPWAAALRFLVTAAGFVLSGALIIALPVMVPFSVGRVHARTVLRALRLVGTAAALFTPLTRLVLLLYNRILAVRRVESVTEEDVLEIMDTAEEHDVIDGSQKEMIGNIFELDDVTASDIMTHRTEVEALSVDAACDEVIRMAIELGFSRIPVYEGNLDNIIGIAYVKDFLSYPNSSTGEERLVNMIRPTFYVPESCRARDLLVEFKQKRMQLAVVVDEYGGTAGIVTMEDILESIVGDIEDENDEEESLISVREDGALVCDGYAEIEDVFEMLGEEVPDDIASDTIGGLVTALLERIPRRDETPRVRYMDIELTVTGSDDRRVTQVIVQRISQQTTGAAQTAQE